MDTSDDPAALAAAFRASHYVVPGLGPAGVLRVGVPACRLEGVLDARRFAFITACNSNTRRDSRLDDAADRALSATLGDARVRCLRAFAHDPGGGHHETGWLVLDLPLRRLDALARRFRQAGALAWTRGHAVRLRMYRPAPADATASAWTDWVE